MTVHVLKCDKPYFDAVDRGDKPFEVRVDDRKPRFETGDVVVLVCTGESHSGRKMICRRIGYLARGGRIPEGYCVFELKSEKDGDAVRAEMAMGRTAVSA